MRFTVLLFLILSLFLFNRYSKAYAKVHQHRISYLQSPSVEKTQQRKFENIIKDFSLNKLANPTQKKQEIISLENEEDDLVFSKKQPLMAMNFILLFYLTHLICSYLFVKIRPPFCWDLTDCKYALQTVLRL